MLNCTLQEVESASESVEDAEDNKPPSPPDPAKSNSGDKKEEEVCMRLRASACIYMHLYASVCNEYSLILYHDRRAVHRLYSQWSGLRVCFSIRNLANKSRHTSFLGHAKI